MSKTFHEIMALPLARVAAAATQWRVTRADKATMARGLADLVDGGSLSMADIRSLTIGGTRPSPAAPTPSAAPDPAAAAVASKAHDAAMAASTRLDTVERSLVGLNQSMVTLAKAMESVEQNVKKALATVDQTARDVAAMPRIDTATIPSQVTAAIDAAFKPFRSAVEAAGAQTIVADAAAAASVERRTGDEVFGMALPVDIDCYANPSAPAVDPHFIWQREILAHLVQCQETGENLWLGGEKGAGKTQTAMQFAARTGRPFTRVNFHKYTTTEEYIGAVGLTGGATGFVPGPFLTAYTTPGAVILLDEPSNCDPGELAMLNGLLEPGAAVSIGGKVWTRAPGVTVIAADNTLGSGDASGRYAGTRTMNSALIDRFARLVPMTFLPLDVEVAAVVNHTGCQEALAEHVLKAITICRSKVQTGHLVDAPSIRQVCAFIRALKWHSVPMAWATTIASKQPPEGLVELEAVFQTAINAAVIQKHI